MPLWHGSPAEGTFNEVMNRQVNKTLMQRYANVTAVKEADVIGILVGTVVVSQYAEIIAQMKGII